MTSYTNCRHCGVVVQTGDGHLCTAYVNGLYGELHIGRSDLDMAIENLCPCGKAPCGLVDVSKISPLCDQHPVEYRKTMRWVHKAMDCPATVKQASVVRPAVGELVRDPRTMESVFLKRREAMLLLDAFAGTVEFDEQEQLFSVVEIFMRMAAHVGRDPMSYVPLKNRYEIEHPFRPMPNGLVYCTYCERTYEQSRHV